MDPSVIKFTAFASGVAAILAVAIALTWGRGGDTAPANHLISVDIGGETELLVQRNQTTVGEWSACVDAGQCADFPTTRGYDEPMVGVDWFSAHVFAEWRSKTDGLPYRLPSSEEWMLFAADFAPPPTEKLFTAPELAWAADYDVSGEPETRAGENLFGLSGLRDDIWEWTSSCDEVGQTAAQNCGSQMIAMGNHPAFLFVFTRDSSKVGCGGGSPPDHLGFRLVADSPA